MTRRVVHLRIRSGVVYNCFVIQQQYGLHPESKPMSTVVSEVLESIINKLVENGDLPQITDQEADTRISEWLSEVPEGNALDINVGLDALGFGGLTPEADAEEDIEEPEDEEPSPESLSQGEEIVRAIQGYTSEKDKDLFREEQDEDESTGPPLSDTPPWQQHGVLSLDEVREQAGPDEIAALYYDDDVMSKALVVVYSNIPRELWGTARAKSLIEQLKPEIERYL